MMSSLAIYVDTAVMDRLRDSRWNHALLFYLIILTKWIIRQIWEKKHFWQLNTETYVNYTEEESNLFVTVILWATTLRKKREVAWIQLAHRPQEQGLGFIVRTWIFSSFLTNVGLTNESTLDILRAKKKYCYNRVL